MKIRIQPFKAFYLAPIALTIVGSTLEAADPVIWQEETHTEAIYSNNSGSSLKRADRTSAGWNGTATSQSAMESDGSLSWKFGRPVGYQFIGLNSSNDSNSFQDLEFSVYGKVKNAYVFENGVYKKDLGSYNSTTSFEIERKNHTILYKKNGNLVYTSTIKSTGSLFADTCFHTYGGALVEVQSNGFKKEKCAGSYTQWKRLKFTGAIAGSLVLEDDSIRTVNTSLYRASSYSAHPSSNDAGTPYPRDFRFCSFPEAMQITWDNRSGSNAQQDDITHFVDSAGNLAIKPRGDSSSQTIRLDFDTPVLVKIRNLRGLDDRDGILAYANQYKGLKEGRVIDSGVDGIPAKANYSGLPGWAAGFVSIASQGSEDGGNFSQGFIGASYNNSIGDQVQYTSTTPVTSLSVTFNNSSTRSAAQAMPFEISYKLPIVE